MKNILCYGDSNTWGNIAGTVNVELRLAKRFDYNTRWTGLLQQLLGDGVHIIEAGLNGRTTARDETVITRPSRNGLSTLPGIMEMHYPLDLVILMLGTNDLKIEFNADPNQITEGVKKLIQFIKESHFGPNYSAPQVMLISPAAMFKTDSPGFDLVYNGQSIAKSEQLASHYASLAQEEQCVFLDAGKIVKIDNNDGIHIDKDSQINFAKAIAEKIINMNL